MTKSGIARCRLGLLLGASLAAACAPLAAFAQDAAAADDAQANPGDGGLEEIVVTAERRETSLQRTPISIVAVSEEKLAEIGAPDIQGLATFVPNLSIGSSALGPVMPGFSIRGVGQSSTRLHQEPGVALYVDDIYYPRTVGSLFQIVDMERIEVLRGPQGTLFGRNAVGGAIRYVTTKPTDKFEGRFQATVGSNGRLDLSAMLNVPITEGVALRVQGARLTDDGYIKVLDWDRTTNTLQDNGRTAGSKDDTLFRGQLRLQPTSELTIDLSASYMRSQGTPPPSLVRSIVPATGAGLNAQRAFRPIQVYLQSVLNKPVLAVNDPLIVAPGYYTDIDRCVSDDPAIPLVSLRTYDMNQICNTRIDNKIEIYTGVIAYNVSDHVTLKSITGYQTLDSDSKVDLWGLDQPSGQREQGKAFSQEAQFLYNSDSLNVTLGAFYFRQHSGEQTFQRRLATPVSPLSPNIVEISGEDTTFDQVAKSWAIYGEATYNITPELFLTGGLRYTDDRKTTKLAATNVSANALFDNSLHFTSTDYRAVLRYQFTPAISAYASTSSGYKAGGFNNRLVAFRPFNPPPAPPIANPQPVVLYEPEQIKNYELGFRSELFDRRVRFNLTGYYMPYKNVIQDYIDFSGPQGAQVFSVNAADVEIKGIEADLNVAPVRGLELNGSIAINDVRFTRLMDGSPALDPLSCPGVALPTAAQCTPMQYARSPKFSFTLGASYSTEIPSIGELKLNANYGHNSRQQSQYSAASSIFLKPYGVLNLRASLDVDAHFNIAGFVTNALGEEYASGGGFGAANNGNVTIEVPGRPREFGVTTTFKF